MLKLDLSKSGVEFSAEQKERAQSANALLESRQGAGNDFLGWVNLPSSIDAAQLGLSTELPAWGLAEVIICNYRRFILGR